MAIGLVGKKRGMTRVFTEDGQSVPVTVVEVTDNRVTQIKNVESDGYDAIQVACGHKKPQKVPNGLKGHYSKAGTDPGDKMVEFRAEASVVNAKALGDSINVDLFTLGEMVDVSGISVGKGFAGVIKRYHFAMQDATHGNSVSHRAPGSIGQNQTPGRVFKGKKMAGHMGSQKTTIQNLEIVRVDTERSVLLIKGSVPGHKDGYVVVTPAMKGGN